MLRKERGGGNRCLCHYTTLHRGAQPAKLSHSNNTAKGLWNIAITRLHYLSSRRFHYHCGQAVLTKQTLLSFLHLDRHRTGHSVLSLSASMGYELSTLTSFDNANRPQDEGRPS